MAEEKLVRLSEVEYYLRQTARNMIDDIESEDKELSEVEKAQAVGCVFAMHTLADNLHRIPTADAVEVVHAMWVHDMYFDQPVIRCTACNMGFAAGHRAERFRFCPNCGAHMRGDDADAP